MFLHLELVCGGLRSTPSSKPECWASSATLVLLARLQHVHRSRSSVVLLIIKNEGPPSPTLGAYGASKNASRG